MPFPLVSGDWLRAKLGVQGLGVYRCSGSASGLIGDLGLRGLALPKQTWKPQKGTYIDCSPRKRVPDRAEVCWERLGVKLGCF